MKIKKLHPDAVIPTKGSPKSAGFDLYAVETVEIPRLSRKIIPTGISIQLPTTYYGRIAPRSGLAVKYGLDVLAGVVDEDYTGEVKVVLYNTASDVYVVQKGDKIAQLIVESYLNPVIEVVEELDETERGELGFGSSGR